MDEKTKQALQAALQNNLGNRLTAELANGILLAAGYFEPAPAAGEAPAAPAAAESQPAA